MCEDCGCMEGNEKAYAEMENHEHSHSHGHVTERKEIHIHIHLDSGADVYVHTHGGESGLLRRHPHQHPHDDATHTHSHVHTHAHGGDDEHRHEHRYSNEDSDAPLPSEQRRSRTISLETNVLAGNDVKAQKNRDWLKAHGVVAVNLISSPGSGKTLLLEKTLEALKGDIQCAVITGDMQTDNDARRMMGKGAKVVQIETRSACHLDAGQIEEQLASVVSEGVKLLFIENVGNLVCPAAFDLGEHEKIALVSVAEGEDKPVKYPVLFHGAGVTLITKTDLVPHLDVDIEKYRDSVKQVNPGARIIEVSAKTGAGMDDWLVYLRNLVECG